MRAERFDWTVEGRETLLRKLYVEEQLSAGEVAQRFAREFGFPVDRVVISRKVITLGLAKLLDPDVLKEQRRHWQAMAVAKREAARVAGGGFEWTEARLARLRQLYHLGWTAWMMARDFGNGCTDVMVRKRITKLGLAGSRPNHVGEDHRRSAILAGQARGAAASSARFAALRAERPKRTKVRVEPSRLIEPDMRALIDAAIAAGKVTVLPAGIAAGITSIERHLKTVPPPKQDWRAVSRQNSRAARLCRKRSAAV